MFSTSYQKGKENKCDICVMVFVPTIHINGFSNLNNAYDKWAKLRQCQFWQFYLKNSRSYTEPKINC